MICYSMEWLARSWRGRVRVSLVHSGLVGYIFVPKLMLDRVSDLLHSLGRQLHTVRPHVGDHTLACAMPSARPLPLRLHQLGTGSQWHW